VDGSEFPVDIHLAPIRSDGHRWTLGVIRDATERHRFLDEVHQARHAAEEVARVKGEFLSLAAHDLCQPEQTLELVIGALSRSTLQASDIDELATIASAALARMRELLKMLLQISRLESGTVKVADEPVSVADIYDDLERQFGPVARAKALRYVSAPCPNIVETDPTLLRGMLGNLLSNAIRYTRQGEVRIQCSTNEEGGLHLAVQDTGIGIPNDQLQAIFNDFNRLAEGRAAHGEGFGLGLGIVRRLSTVLGLSVTVESALGRGSTFRVRIPPDKVFRTA
jgi:signal transduction histidine kinase